ncbi:hypothetical protein YC2023_042188 [Brassica napus]
MVIIILIPLDLKTQIKTRTELDKSNSINDYGSENMANHSLCRSRSDWVSQNIYAISSYPYTMIKRQN